MLEALVVKLLISAVMIDNFNAAGDAYGDDKNDSRDGAKRDDSSHLQHLV